MSISTSGETAEIIEMQRWVRGCGARTVAITNVRDSSLAAGADRALLTRAGRERAVPATKSDTAQLAATAVIAGALGQPDARLEALRSVPDHVRRLLAERAGADAAVTALAGALQLMVTGRCLVYGIALEIALKLGETCLQPVRGLPYTDPRHDPITVVDGGMLAVLVAEAHGPMGGAIAHLPGDLRRLGFASVGIGGEAGFRAACDVPVPVPPLPEAVASLDLVVPAQLIGEGLALKLGQDSDAPRGLTKVTHSDPGGVQRHCRGQVRYSLTHEDDGRAATHPALDPTNARPCSIPAAMMSRDHPSNEAGVAMNQQTLRIWHVGNWCAHWGDEYRESAFRSSIKDFKVLNYARYFVRALERIPGAQVASIPSWELYHLSPEEFDERLDWADVIIFADVETQSLQLNPAFFQDQFGSTPRTFPDRFDLLRDWVDGGGHFHMNGGWFSFSGHQGYGGWGRSRWQKDTADLLLPVGCLQGDDLIESSASYEVRSTDPSHPVVDGIDWSEIPPILGFNETVRVPDAEVLVEVRNGHTWYPLLAQKAYGAGRTSAWTTGASPHWGINFMKWEHYDRFWRQVFTA